MRLERGEAPAPDGRTLQHVCTRAEATEDRSLCQTARSGKQTMGQNRQHRRYRIPPRLPGQAPKRWCSVEKPTFHPVISPAFNGTAKHVHTIPAARTASSTASTRPVPAAAPTASSTEHPSATIAGPAGLQRDSKDCFTRSPEEGGGVVSGPSRPGGAAYPPAGAAARCAAAGLVT